MSGPKKDEELEGLDWDSALAEWEEKTFLPEAAKDKETHKPGVLTGTPPPPPPGPTSGAPLYRPMSGSAGPIIASMDDDEEDDEGSGATVIAAIPRELLRGAGRVDEASRASGGGLGQLFSRGRDDLREAYEVEEPSVVTSAKALGLRNDGRAGDEGLRKRPTLVDANEVVPEGALFDPFAEPIPVDEGTPAMGVPAPTAPPPPMVPSARTPAPKKGAPPKTPSPPSGRSTVRFNDDVPPTPLPPSPPPLGALESIEAADHDVDVAESEVSIEETPIDESALGLDDAETGERISQGPPLHAPARRAFDPNDDTSVHVKGAIHSPAQREYDPNEETSVLSKSLLPGAMRGRGEGGEEEPTALRRRASRAPKTTLSWDDERPACEAMSEAARAAFVARAEWLEAEARTAPDREARARILLTVSELRAIVGENEAAEILAREASALNPQLALAPRQARSLAPGPHDAVTLVEALDAETRQSPTAASRAHGALLAGDVLRLGGDDEGALKRWEKAMRFFPSDPRAPLARAARALARGELTHAHLRLEADAELAPLAQAVANAVRLRGAERGDLPAAGFLPNDALRRARAALDRGDVARAAVDVGELRNVPGLDGPAAWLAAMLAVPKASARPLAADWLRALRGETHDAARRAIAARAIELGDRALGQEALAEGSPFTPDDRAAVATLLALPAGADDADLDALGARDDGRPLAAAIAAAFGSGDASAARVAGAPLTRRRVTLGRRLAAASSSSALEEAAHAMDGEHDGESRAVTLELALRAGRFEDVSDGLAAWTDEGEEESAARDRQLAAAMIAERTGDRGRAVAAYAAALRLDGTNEAALRALLALDEETDAVLALTALANEVGTGPRAAIARLEAVSREAPDDAAHASLLDEAHRAAPEIPIAAYLAERAARRSDRTDDVLRWVAERRAASRDPIERAVDAVREAALLGDVAPETAATLLEEAHRARPSDVALRERWERVAHVDPAEAGAWRELRAASAPSATKGRLLLAASREYERAGDHAAALRAASAAVAASGDPLAQLAVERAELSTGAAARLADELLSRARTTEDAGERRDAFARLADLDATGRDDLASALLWHRSILDEAPDALPSLRHVEHALLSDARVDELEPVVLAVARALAAKGDTAGEASSHAALAMRLRMRGPVGDWDGTHEAVALAAAEPSPALWALRALQAHARVRGDDAELETASVALAERTSRSPETAALLLRAAEAAIRADRMPRARELLERIVQEDPGDVVTWGLLADVRARLGDARGAAEACESLARTSVVPEHQIVAWVDAARAWLDDVADVERGLFALEQAAGIDVTFGDVFPRLSALYVQRGARGEQAALLERRLAQVSDPAERVALEVERGRALAELGDVRGARTAFEGALAAQPDHTGALAAYADLSASQRDWDAAEQAWVRLSRLLPSPDDQRAVYARLGELYAVHAVNLSRADVALREVLKRAPDDVPTLERLVDVYKRQSDGARALETQQQLVKLASSPEERRRRLLELAAVHEQTMRDPRKAEQALESARREGPTDVTVLRALVEFYRRQKQLPAVNILLDRASADVRRAFAAGRFSPDLFAVVGAVFELRGKREAAHAVTASLAALEARPSVLPGAQGRAADPRLDDLLAPEALSGGLRTLLLRAGDALDQASQLDLRALQAQPLATGAAQAKIAALATSMGLPPVNVLVSPKLGRTCVPSASAPPAVVVGEALVPLVGEPSGAFLVARALKLVQAHASALVRTPPADLVVLVTAWLQAFNPSWTPPGVNAAQLADASRRVRAAMPKGLDPELPVVALEVSGTLAAHLGTLGASAMAWADRVALLAIGDPGAALDAIAWSQGAEAGAPRDPAQRGPWVARTGEARDLLLFSVSDAYAELRTRLHLG